MELKRGYCAVLAAAVLAAVSGCSLMNMGAAQPLRVTVMTQAAVGNSVTPDSPVKKRVEELTNTRLSLEFVPPEQYSAELNSRLAAGRLPTITFINENTPNIIKAARSGEFWDITDYIKDYKNLSKTGDAFLRDISIDGRVYGLCRRRPVGRYGYVYRRDWLDDLGMKEPETAEEFCAMLRAFTFNDPDGNGRNDTYGMTVTNTDITFYNFAVWMGAPNEWGFDADGHLIPDHLTEGYYEAMRQMRTLVSEGVINSDLMVMNPSDWNEPFIEGKSGVILDTCDRAGALLAPVTANFPKAEIGVAGVINGRARPHLGYSGYFAFPKSSVKDEATLKRLLEFMDRCSDDDVFTLMRYGIEGRHYDMENGYVKQRTGPEVPREEINDFNQVLTYAGNVENEKIEQTELQKTINAVQKDNEKHIVGNPAEGLISDTYLEKGAELDAIVRNARVMYISGQIDDEGYAERMRQWRESGGNAVIDEINKAYEARKQ